MAFGRTDRSAGSRIGRWIAWQLGGFSLRKIGRAVVRAFGCRPGNRSGAARFFASDSRRASTSSLPVRIVATDNHAAESCKATIYIDSIWRWRTGKLDLNCISSRCTLSLFAKSLLRSVTKASRRIICSASRTSSATTGNRNRSRCCRAGTIGGQQIQLARIRSNRNKSYRITCSTPAARRIDALYRRACSVWRIIMSAINR